MFDDLRRLRWSIQALACPADEQVTLFPDFTCKADELALSFEEHAQPFLDPECRGLDMEQQRSLDELDQYLDQVSGMGENAVNWTDPGLYADGVWPEIRRLATVVLSAFGWERVNPGQEPGVAYVGPEVH